MFCSLLENESAWYRRSSVLYKWNGFKNDYYFWKKTRISDQLRLWVHEHFGFSPDYAEQEAIKRRDNTQSDKGKFLFVKLSLIAAQWLSNLCKNGNLFCGTQHKIQSPLQSFYKNSLILFYENKSCRKEIENFNFEIILTVFIQIDWSRLYNKGLAFKLGTFIVDIPCFAAGKCNFELHLVVQPVDVLSVVGNLLLWPNRLLDVRRQARELNF